MNHSDASKRAAAHRLPPPTRTRRTMRVVAPARFARASLPSVSAVSVVDFDEPTVRDVAPLPPPPVAPLLASSSAAVPQWVRSPEPTQIVTPLPPPAPPRVAESYGRILDTESTGGRISGEVSTAAALPPAPTWWAARRWLLAGMAGVAVLLGVVAGLAIGRSTHEASAVAPGDVPRAVGDRDAPVDPALITIEELPRPASVEPRTTPPSAEPVVAKPARSRHRATWPAAPRPTANHRQGRPSKPLAYDPDALFLKRF